MDRSSMPQAFGVGGSAKVTSVIAKPLIPPEYRCRAPRLGLQFTDVEQHCHSLAERPGKGEEALRKS